MGQKAGSFNSIKNKGHEKNGKYLMSWGHVDNFSGSAKEEGN